jgi:hypothetical protein
MQAFGTIATSFDRDEPMALTRRGEQKDFFFSFAAARKASRASADKTEATLQCGAWRKKGNPSSICSVESALCFR